MLPPAEEAPAPSRDPRELQDAALAALGYQEFGEEIEGPIVSGVVTNRRQRVAPGLVLVCSRSTKRAALIDPRGQTAFQWSLPEGLKSKGWLHAELAANGDLLVIEKGSRLTRLAPTGELVWRHEFAAHHDLHELPDGSLAALEFDPRRQSGVQLSCSNLVRLSAAGEVLERLSLFDLYADIEDQLPEADRLEVAIAAEKQRLAELGFADPPIERTFLDFFHANSLAPVGDAVSARSEGRWRPDDWVVCIRNRNLVLIVRWEERRVVDHFGSDLLDWPHHPTPLSNGTVLVYDNGKHRGATRVLEFDPATGEIAWQYPQRPDAELLSSPEMGSCQRLENGNTLIAESHSGRVFEVTRTGEVVWDWYTPVVSNGRRENLYRAEKLDPKVLERLRR
ncbi:MAG: arylsulfotransferase family protein [Planctomycetota bacterium]